jgi:Holliday junction resolvase RusA-like endonuclease
MALLTWETSVWVSGRPKSLQAKNLRPYQNHVAAAARPHFASLATGPVEIEIFYVEDPPGERLDPDNVPKPINDALKGIVYADDNVVVSARCHVVPKDEALKERNGVPHLTFARLLTGDEFLIRVLRPDVPSVTHTLRTS